MHRNLECQVHESRQIGSGQTGDERVNVDILGIRELKWTGMGEFKSDDHYIYYYIFKSRDITLPTKVSLVKAMVFSCGYVWM